MTAIGLPAINGFQSVDWRLKRNVKAMRGLGNSLQRAETAGAAWAMTLQTPPAQGDEAGVLKAWLAQVSRGDRWMYLSPPHSSVRGNWNPAELISNGRFLSGLTTGWSANDSTLSVNARRLRVTNTVASSRGSGFIDMTCETDKPHIVLVDVADGNVDSAQIQVMTTGSVAEQIGFVDGACRRALMFYPSQAAMRLRLFLDTTNVGDYIHFGNVSVSRCLTVNGGGQLGNTLAVDGGPSSTNAALKAGEFVSLRVGDRWQLLELIEDLDTGATGAGTLRFEPALRDYPVDGAAVIVRNPFLRCALSEDQSVDKVGAPNFHGFVVEAMEDITEIAGEIQDELIWAWDAETLSLAPVIGSGTPAFTRAGTATRFNASGALELVAANVARIDYDPVTLAVKGFLMEEARTNLLLNSLLSGANLSTQSVTVTAVAHTLSFYGTGTVTLTGASTAGPLVGGGAYPTRSTLTFTPSAGSLTLTVSGTVQFAQLEIGSFASSFIPTAGAAVPRAADAPTLTTASIPGFNALALTMLAEAYGAPAANAVLMSISDNTANERHFIHASAGGAAQFSVVDGGATQAAITQAAWANGVLGRAVAAAALNDFALSFNGAAVGTDVAGTLASLTTLHPGVAPGSVDFWNSHIRRLRVYNRRMPNQFVKALAT